MDREEEASTEVYGDTFGAPEVATQGNIITSGRIVNSLIVAVCLLGMISSIVCLAVMAHKHNQIVEYRDAGQSQPGDNEVCILFASSEETFRNATRTEYTIKYNKSHTCQFVIFGSAFVAGMLLIALCYHILRLFLWLE